MCSIFGVIIKDVEKFKRSRNFEQIFKLSRARGMDANGIVHIDMKREGFLKIINVDMNDFSAIDNIIKNRCNDGDMFMGNCRAVPTTEIMCGDDMNDYSPFISNSRDTVIAFNGIISNDDELCRAFDLHPQSKIDTSVICELVDKVGVDETIGHLDSGFALSIWNVDDPRTLVLVNNFKPIYIYENDEAIYYSSLEEYLSPLFKSTINKPLEVGPYEMIRLTSAGVSGRMSLIPEVNTKDQKCLVIASAGLDSTTVIGIQKLKYQTVDLLHFTYGCKAESRELDRIKKIAQYYNCKLHIINMTSLYKNIGGSTLLDPDSKIASGIKGTEKAMEWVPARNTVMLSVAIAFTESHKYDVISTGVNLEESGSYSDNEENFFIKFNKLMGNVTNMGNHVIIENPLKNCMKHDIVRIGLRLKVPYHLTWSCYESGSDGKSDKGTHICGNCGPCYMRRIAFERNGKVDPLITLNNGVNDININNNSI